MKELDLTQGNVVKVLLRFALPFILANVLQAFYGAADLFIVGQYEGADTVAAVAIGSQIMQTLTGAILGIATGTTVLLAIAVGAKNDRQAADTIGSSIYLFSAIGIAATLAMTLLHNSVTQIMNTPIESIEATNSYILICSTGIIFIMGYNVVCSIFRGLGDSKTPLYFVGVACVINIVLDYILVGYCGIGASGAAIATVSAQGISFFGALILQYRRGFKFEFSRQNIRINGVINKKILKLGAPIALQDVLINVSFLIITVIVNRMGVVASASLGIVEKIIIFAMIPPIAIAAAVATFTAQNFGARMHDRIRNGVKTGIGISLVFGTAFAIYANLAPERVIGIFTSDYEIIAMASGYLQGYSVDCILVAFIFILNAYFSGQGNSIFPMTHSLLSTFLIRIPLSYIFSVIDDSSLLLMGFAIPLASVVSLIICVWYIKSGTFNRSLQRHLS